MLELAILGLLKEQDLHGYELKKRLADTVGSGTGVSYGSLYPALGRLEKTGAVQVVPAHATAGKGLAATEALAGEPAAIWGAKTGTRGGRGKKVYGITAAGQRLFEELLTADAGSSEDERAFNLRLAFARHLSRDARIGMLERRRAFLMARLARTTGAVRHGWGRLDAYTRSLMEHGNETTEHDICWLDRLIARERAEGADTSTESQGADPSGALATTAWAASAPPTMPVRPSAGPFVSSSSHSRGGNIQ